MSTHPATSDRITVLRPDTVDALLSSLEIDALEFRQKQILPLIDKGWDKILARFYALIAESKRKGNKITQDKPC
ncbi:hypothetical protein LC609_22605 [Nostoc sp. XA013]|nr:hypothetical protein [Nostoc sp. XA013]